MANAMPHHFLSSQLIKNPSQKILVPHYPMREAVCLHMLQQREIGRTLSKGPESATWRYESRRRLERRRRQ
jgi:hypothetical protein